MPDSQHRFGNMAGEVLNSGLVFQLKFSTKLNFCASIAATSPSRKPLPATAIDDSAYINDSELNKFDA